MSGARRARLPVGRTTSAPPSRIYAPREQWEKLQPKLVELEKSFADGAHKAGSAVAEQASTITAALKKLLGEITAKKADPEPPAAK